MNEKKDNNDSADTPFSESKELFENIFKEGLKKEVEKQEKIKAGEKVTPTADLPQKKVPAVPSKAGKDKPVSPASASRSKAKPTLPPKPGTDRPVSAESAGRRKTEPIPPVKTSPKKPDQPEKTAKQPGIQKGESSGLKKKPLIGTAQKVKSSAPLKTPPEKPVLEEKASKERKEPPAAQSKIPGPTKKVQAEKEGKPENVPLATEESASKEVSEKIPLKEKTEKSSSNLIYILSGVLILVIAGFIAHYFGVIDIQGLMGISKSEDETIIIQSIPQKKPDIPASRESGSPPVISEKVEPKKEAVAVQINPPEKETVSTETQTPLAEGKKEISDTKDSLSEKSPPKEKELTQMKEVTEIEKSADIKVSDFSKTASSYPYSIYLGSFSNTDEIKKTITMYNEMGLEPYHVKIDLGEKGIWFRLFAGYFQKRSEAQKLIDTMNIKEAVTKSTKYANLIGMYTSKDALEEKRTALVQQQYSPYVITEGTNNFFLYVGAFYQKARAEEQNDELASSNFQSRMVER